MRQVLVILALISVVASQAPSASYYTTPAINANATVYDYTSYMGGCGYLDWTAQDFGVSYTVGVSTQQFLGGEICGMCAQVRYVAQGSTVYANPAPFPTTEPFYIMVNNLGLNFAGWQNHFDFLFDGHQYPGHWIIDWQATECPGNLPLSWQLTGGGNGWWLQILPVYQKITITQMCAFVAGSWRSLVRVGNGMWQYNGGSFGAQLPSNPIVAVISADGQVVIDTIQVSLGEVPGSAVYPGTGVNFGGLNSAGLTAATPTCGDLASPESGYADLGPMGTKPVEHESSSSGKGGGDGLSTGGIVGVVIGSVAGASFFAIGVLLVIVAVVFAIKYKKQQAAKGGNYVLMGGDHSLRV